MSQIFDKDKFTHIPPFSRKPVTNRLIEFFAGTSPGEEFTDEEISKIAGCTRDAWKGVMGTVQKVLLDDERYHIRLVRVATVGYRHAKDDDVVQGVEARKRSAHKHFVKGAREFRNGIKEPDKLTSEQLRTGIMVNTMASLTSPKANRVLAAAKVNNSKLDMGSFLDLMRKKLTDGE